MNKQYVHRSITSARFTYRLNRITAKMGFGLILCFMGYLPQLFKFTNWLSVATPLTSASFVLGF